MVRWRQPSKSGLVMKTELRLTVAAIAAALPLLSAGASQTINFGTQPGLPSYPPGGTVPDGYAGFDWHGAQNDVYYALSGSNGFDSAYITEMSRTAPFDLDSMFQVALDSDVPSPFETSVLTTTISGYLNGALVETLTETFPWFDAGKLTLNMDGVNDVKFSTVETLTELDTPGHPSFTGPDLTMVTQMTVDNYTGVAKAPELDPASTASAVTLLFGSLLVIRGRRAKGLAASR
jgi:hypothetical protein